MNSNYTIAFFHPKIGKPVFLANTADINKICYEEYPQIPGTFDIAKAKIYKDLDEAKNVICTLGKPNDKIVVFMAHTDTVFPDTESYPEYREDDERIYCPAVGDDTVRVATVMMCAKYFIDNNITPEKAASIIHQRIIKARPVPHLNFVYCRRQLGLDRTGGSHILL